MLMAVACLILSSYLFVVFVLVYPHNTYISIIHKWVCVYLCIYIVGYYYYYYYQNTLCCLLAYFLACLLAIFYTRTYVLLTFGPRSINVEAKFPFNLVSCCALKWPFYNNIELDASESYYWTLGKCPPCNIAIAIDCRFNFKDFSQQTFSHF